MLVLYPSDIGYAASRVYIEPLLPAHSHVTGKLQSALSLLLSLQARGGEDDTREWKGKWALKDIPQRRTKGILYNRTGTEDLDWMHMQS